MADLTFVLKHASDAESISFEKPSAQYMAKIADILRRCDKNNGGFVKVTFGIPRKPRTTGEGSQNNLFWKLATIISEYTGNDLEDVEAGLKERAISKGYPYHINRITGRPQGNSMTTIDTVQCSYLIDTAYEVCAELGISVTPE